MYTFFNKEQLHNAIRLPFLPIRTRYRRSLRGMAECKTCAWCSLAATSERWRRSHKRPPPSFPVSNLSYAQVVLKSASYDKVSILPVSKLTSLRGDTAMQIYGYCRRISTPQQNIERQVRNILSMYPTAHIIREVYTGTTYQGRRELDKLLHTVQAGDTIVFDSVSRMSRNADEGCQLYEALYAQNVTLCFLKEPHINTETYRQTIQRQISTQLETGNAATDSFVSSVIAALNQYTVDPCQRADTPLPLHRLKGSRRPASAHQRGMC